MRIKLLTPSPDQGRSVIDGTLLVHWYIGTLLPIIVWHNKEAKYATLYEGSQEKNMKNENNSVKK